MHGRREGQRGRDGQSEAQDKCDGEEESVIGSHIWKSPRVTEPTGELENKSVFGDSVWKSAEPSGGESAKRGTISTAGRICGSLPGTTAMSRGRATQSKTTPTA